MGIITESERTTLLTDMRNLLMQYDYGYTDSAIIAIINEWEEQKETLIEAFKRHPNYIEGKFMIAFNNNYERAVSTIQSGAFSNWLCSCDNMFELQSIISEEIAEQRDRDHCRWLPSEMYNFIHNLAEYATTYISDDTTELLNRIWPDIHAHSGQKTSRVVNKLLCYIGFDKLDGYQREFAKYADSLSPITIKRHTVLSINPLDYLTMSFGNSWASCHTIDKTNKRNMPNSYSGCYSSGTISYMLDKVSMVFYTVDASYDGNEYWNEPKINRQMFHYGEDKLIQGRLYPQDNDGASATYTQYRNVVQELVSTMFDFPNLWHTKKGTDAASKYIYSHGTHYRDYENYGNCTLSMRTGVENNACIVVGHDPICVECGSEHDVAESINCCGYGYICSRCGSRITDEEDVIWVDGECYCNDCAFWCDDCDSYCVSEAHYVRRGGYGRYVCDECYEEYYAVCPHCGVAHYQPHMNYIRSNGTYVCDDCLSLYTRCDDCEDWVLGTEVYITKDGTFCEECYNRYKNKQAEA